MNTLLFVLWYFLPAGLANTAPIFASHTPFLKKFDFPLDFGMKFKGQRIFGDHKTIRGLISGIIVGIIVVGIEVWTFGEFRWVREFVTIDYHQVNPFLLGTLAGLGALGGDAIKSFFKRQLAITSGKSWIPFDQLDYIVGGCLLMAVYLPLTFIQYIWLFIIWFLLHPIATIIGYFLKLKKEPI